MKTIVLPVLAATATLVLATPSLAQSGPADWTGPYIGGSLGYSWQPDDDNETIVFDTNGDGVFNDTVANTAGANAFSPGFCGGGSTSTAPGSGCSDDKGGFDWAVHAGYDVQFGSLVGGIVVEAGKTRMRDSVSGFSTTPASYTLSRSMDWNAAARARLGFAAGSATLIYATGGIAYGKVKNSFTTSNTFNTFTQTNSDDDAWGWVAGGGIEQKLTDQISVGALYKYTRYNADGYRVNAGQGTPPSTTNPFVITPAGSTDFARDSKFDTHSVSATASFRF